MDARAATCPAGEADGCACLDHLAYGSEVLGEVAIDGLQAVAVADDHHIAVASGLIVNHSHLAVEGCADGVAQICVDVQTLVLAAEARTVAVVGSDDAVCRRHAEMPQVDLVVFRQLHIGVKVDTAVLPVGVEVALYLGFLDCLLLDEALYGDAVDGSHLLVNRCLTCYQVLCGHR